MLYHRPYLLRMVRLILRVFVLMFWQGTGERDTRLTFFSEVPVTTAMRTSL